MNLDAQEFLDLVEESSKIVFFDLESLGLKGDYNSIICGSFKPYDKDPYTIAIKQPGNDQKVAKDIKAELEKYICWVTYFGRGFDLAMINTRLLRWGLPPVEKRLHIDLYFVLKYGLLTGRKSQSHLLSWLKTDEQKMSVSASVWSEFPFKMKEHLPVLIERCESDVEGLEALYKRTRHLIMDVRK